MVNANKSCRNTSKLLGLSDSIRAALYRGRKLTPLELEELTFVLDMMLVGEIDENTASKAPTASQKITFSVIQNTRLDKLLAETIQVYENENNSARPRIAEVGLGSEVETVQSLQKQWRARFKSEYFALDQYRLDSLFSNALRDVLFSAIASDGLGIWSPTQPIAHELSEAEVSLHYTPGTLVPLSMCEILESEGPKAHRVCSWWLNIGCAHRDGIVGAAFQRPTKGRYGVAALPLLTGSEERLPDGRMEYCRRGKQHEMYYSLLTQVGQKTKVLRGFRLKSIYAPVAGLRYDGM